MHTTLGIGLLALIGMTAMQAAGQATPPRLAHMVYFKLKESTAEGRRQLIAACKKYLSGHEGTVFFSVGVLAEELRRDVNVRDFDVALIVVFEDKAAHDRYQTDPRHLKFIEENKATWASVRVFDAYLEDQ